MVDTESHPRPRRSRHDSAKHYDAERKDLELSQVLDILQRHVDYGGGINCCVCGKLYKSRVCFIKHLWEHTVYWDQFAGDKNHMRVLSIQAALILYGTCQQPLHPVPVDSLLVSSPHITEHINDGKVLSSAETTSRKVLSAVSKDVDEGYCSAHSTPIMLPTTPVRKSASLSLHVPKTPVKNVMRSPAAFKRKAPPRLDFSTPSKKKIPATVPSSPAPPRLDFSTPSKKKTPATVPSSPVEEPQPVVHSPIVNSPNPLGLSPSAPFLHTPVKQRIPCMLPKTPKKSRKRVAGAGGASVSNHPSQRVSRFLIPASDVTSDTRCWKESDSCSSKRKRSE